MPNNKIPKQKQNERYKDEPAAGICNVIVSVYMQF